MVSAPGALVAAAAGTTDPVTAYTKTADVRVAMPDGVSLDTDEYVPTTGCPCPVILVQTPYRKSGSAVGMFNPYFPSHGYAEIVVDVRGTGSSEGFWDSFGPKERADGVVLVQRAASRPFSNGTVGLAGVSYAAINQFLTVEQPGTEAVKAIFPIVPMGDSYRDVVFAGGNTDTGFIPLWLGLVNGLNAIPADDATANPQIALNAQSQHLRDVARFGVPAVADATLGAYESKLPSQAQRFPDQAYDNAFFRGSSPLDGVDRVKVPTFIVGGEYDIFQRGEPLLYRGLNLPTSQKKLVYGPWYHGSPSAHLTADDGSAPVTDLQGNVLPSTNNLALAWFDHWLKGVDNGIDGFPTVETYQIGRGAWSADTSFPAAGTTYRPWYLDGAASGSGAQALFDGSLANAAGAAGSATLPWQPITGACSRSSTQWTAGIVSAGSCPDDNSSAELTGVSFTSQPFTSDYTVSGPIMADLWVSSTRRNTTLVATVTDVHPDGTSDRVTAGSLVASFRAETATACGAKVMDCTLYADGVPVIPWHPYTRASQAMLEPGTPTEMKVEIFPTSLVLQPGHRLRVSITTGDLPHQGPNTWVTTKSAGGVSTIHFGGATPSSVYLGVVGGNTALAAPVAAGAAVPATATSSVAAPAAAPALGQLTTTAVAERAPLTPMAVVALLLVTLFGAAAAGRLLRRPRAH
ncbi:MAG: uncharacterized protein QOE92_1752 [Chloroflexota bacterium]|jgi:putative CocE/NonD family hydrolase|nr:uncharacterized protein [Chloroflexota bacterium]